MRANSEENIYSGGWVSLNKPSGISSNNALKIIKRTFNLKKVGFSGTLDPLASGVLPIAFGSATKTIPFLDSCKKEYKFIIKWGTLTETHDLEGEILDSSEIRPNVREINSIITKFIGEVKQRPPRFSAIKVSGRRAYTLARRNENFTLPKRLVTIYSLKLVRIIDNDYAEFKISCGKGFYVRSLARDISLELGTLGVLASLERLKVGPFTLKNAFPLESFTNLVHSAPAGKIEEKYLLPLSKVLDDIPALSLEEQEARIFKQGQIINKKSLVDALPQGSDVLLFNSNRPIGLAVMVESALKPKRVFSDEIF